MSARRKDWIVIGMSGVTCGGKTTLSNQILGCVDDIRVLHQDKYFLPDDDPRHRPVPGLSPPHHNYDILSALDMDRMYRDAVDIIGGAEIEHGRSNPRQPGMLYVPGKKILLMEGFTALNYRPLYELCDIRYYFILEYGECFARRVHRVYDPPDVPGYFEACVWPEHLRYRAQLEHDPDVSVIDGTQSDSMAFVLRQLRRWGAVEIPT